MATTAKRVTGGMGDIVTRRQAARILECHADTVSRLIADGPLATAVIDRKGPRRAVRMSRHAIETYKAVRDSGREIDPAAERARKDRAAADLSEFRLQVERDKYLPADEVERQKAAENSALKAILMSWGSTLSDAVIRAKKSLGAEGVERLIEREVRAVLTELADPERPVACPACGINMADAAVLEEGGDGARCRARTADGVKCKNSARVDGYCYIESHRAA